MNIINLSQTFIFGNAIGTVVYSLKINRHSSLSCNEMYVTENSKWFALRQSSAANDTRIHFKSSLFYLKYQEVNLEF